MNERSERAHKLYLDLRDLDPNARADAVDRECGDDSELRAELGALLAGHDATSAAAWVDGAVTHRRGHGQNPERIGAYQIVRELDRGAHGIVYLGIREDAQFRRRAAIKVLKRRDTDEILHRFELERRLLAGLNHPGIARLYEGGETDEGMPYFAMEYVEGQPINEFCDTHRLRISERLELFRSVCAAVHYAHKNLVIHRDIKPKNILVTGDGNPKLLDFGIAKVINPDLSIAGDLPTAPDFRVMTPEYASPEQFRGHSITTASDIYSLGVLLYELVTGHRPYRLDSRIREEIERVICENDPEKPSTAVSRIEQVGPKHGDPADPTSTITPERVSLVREGHPDRLRRRLAGDIDNIVLMAMRKEPQRRYDSAEQFAEDLRRHLDGMPVLASEDTLGYRCAKFVHRHRAGVAAAVIVAVLLLGGTVVAASGWRAEGRQRATTEEERATAEHQRDRAERMFGQVRQIAHALMFDIHDAIQQLDGSVPARELLVNAAVEYLEEVTPDVGDDAELKRDIASGYDRVGDIQGGVRNPTRGDTAAAIQSYEMGRLMRQELVETNPDDLELQKELSTSDMHVGDMLTRTGDLTGALAAYEHALAIQEGIAQADPTFERQLYLGLNNVGKTMREFLKLDEASLLFERSLVLRQRYLERVSAADPANPHLGLFRRDVSVQLIDSGELSELLGNDEDALKMYRSAIEIRRSLLDEDPKNARRQRDLAVGQFFAGRVLVSLDRSAEAMRYLEPLMATASQRALDNQDDARSKDDLANTYEVLGMAKIAMEDAKGALRSYRDFHDIVVGLRESDSSNTAYRMMEADSHERIAEAQLARGELDEAIQSYEQAVHIVAGLSDADPHNPNLRIDMARSLSALGEQLLHTGELVEAQENLDSAFGLYEGLYETQPKHAAIRRGLATTLERRSQLMAERGYILEAIASAEQALDLLSSATGPKAAATRHKAEDNLMRYRR